MSSPDTTGVTPAIQVLRILEKMYDGKFWTASKLAKATALSEQAVRNRLEDMGDQEWAESDIVGNTFHYRITPKALLRVAQICIETMAEETNKQIALITEAFISKMKEEQESSNDQK